MTGLTIIETRMFILLIITPILMEAASLHFEEVLQISFWVVVFVSKVYLFGGGLETSHRFD